MSVTRLQFQNDIEMLNRRLLKMGTEADTLLANAVKALLEHDGVLAETVIAGDDVIDELDQEIEDDCIQLIARQQPVARDLRLIGTAFNIVTDLERIGDHAVDIAKIAQRLAEETFYKPLVDLPQLVDSVRAMLRSALAAYVNVDILLVDTVITEDDKVDALFRRLREDLNEAMQRDNAVVVQASYLLFVTHYLERIADHAVNIAERVYYIETGSLAPLAADRRAVRKAA